MSAEQAHFAGVYQHVKPVLDVDKFYYLAGQYLECSRCKGKLISWSLPMLNQLDLSHWFQFPIMLTYCYACDLNVIDTMRQRTLWNGLAQLMTTVREKHRAVDAAGAHVRGCPGAVPEGPRCRSGNSSLCPVALGSILPGCCAEAD
ncbi:uncharacterized protein [Littorina saxatilis]|uniref:uncharacterized protein n=1 Tax=Littorina saxatilis TaxID=31220 RepID=UPI0038B4DFD2